MNVTEPEAKCAPVTRFLLHLCWPFCLCALSVQIEKCKHRKLLRFLCGWMAFLFTTRILDLEFLSGSLIVALCGVQHITVDSKVKRNLNTENSELPRPSTHLRTPTIEFETEAIQVTITFLCFFGLRGLRVG